MAKIRRRLTRRGPLPFRYVFLLTFVFFIFSTAASLFIIDKGIEPTLMSYADTQTRRIASLVINNAVKSNVTNVKDIRDIIEEDTSTSGEGESSLQRLNTATITQILSETQRLVQKNLAQAEKGNIAALEETFDVEIEEDNTGKGEGIVYHIPLGQATNNALLGNLGPKIPVRFTPIGDVSTNIVTKVQDHGINNIWIEVYVKIEVNVQIIVPFATKIAKMEQSIPVAMGLFKGDVPQFYNNGGSDSGPSLELPMN